MGLFIDLTAPEDIYATVTPLMEVVRKKLELIMKEMNNTEPNLYDKIKKGVMKKFEGHKVRQFSLFNFSC